ncbi:RimJ/RimL family protein N-acetyltransferase [Streptococcus loxodontisalivarius]|uniref:RimJ/RimL family protein N-acetyltransferase n=1 Tax=Streptococcus loxodontisalivarius TaxID=1349415 RepID=A0ABS2PUN2_9STRE|nr:RimJ/RimL family protein N-acetyltransferase [Streptococcus loxodontisalivarius]
MADYFAFYGPESSATQWTYFPLEPFEDKESLRQHLKMMETSRDPYFLAIKDKETWHVLGTFSIMSISTANRTAEMGWVLYGDQLKNSRLATEAQYLVMTYIFEELAYRRYEWRCDSLNTPSNNAAQRLGFTFEGTFRQAVVYKNNRSRDTNWYSMLPEEFQAMKPKFEKWLAAENFDESGKQIKSLKDC